MAISVSISLLVGFAHVQAAERDLSTINPPFPRIGNCYHAGLDQAWERGSSYWRKVGLIIGGCYDLHYDWEKPDWAKRLAKVEQNIARLRQINPHVIVLPYVDVVEGPDNPAVPKEWWALKDGKRFSGWPGYYRIDTKLPAVLQFNLDQVRSEICGRECFDGVFYDCWGVDDWLVPHTAALRNGKAVVMVNDWNLPRQGFAALNGVLAEDEINRVLDGRVDFEDFLARYFRWTRETRKPCVTMIVCQPQNIVSDPWQWSKVDYKQRQAKIEKLRVLDEQTMRFGLATTLMSDGYFGYDSGTAGRGNWWWYKEYDAPLGHPHGLAHRNADGTWQREFDGGVVVVNGTLYDAVAKLDANSRDLSTGRVGRQFMIPQFDGRIFLPTDAPATSTPDEEPRLTAAPAEKLRSAVLRDGAMAVQTPGGLDLRFGAEGALRNVLWHGHTLCTGGWPAITVPQSGEFHAVNVTGGVAKANAAGVNLTFRGELTEGDQRIDYVETCAITPDNRFTLRFEFTAATDLTIRLWRHYFAFPVARYAGANASTDGKRVTLSPEVKNDSLLPSAKHFSIESKDARITLDSSLSLALVDHRKYHREEYLLAGYPVFRAAKRGEKFVVEMTVGVSAP